MQQRALDRASATDEAEANGQPPRARLHPTCMDRSTSIFHEASRHRKERCTSARRERVDYRGDNLGLGEHEATGERQQGASGIDTNKRGGWDDIVRGIETRRNFGRAND